MKLSQNGEKEEKISSKMRILGLVSEPQWSHQTYSYHQRRKDRENAYTRYQTPKGSFRTCK